MTLSYLSFGATFIYLIFFLWLVWTKTLWAKKTKIFVTILIVLMALSLCYSVYFFRPFSYYEGGQDLVDELGQ